LEFSELKQQYNEYCEGPSSTNAGKGGVGHLETQTSQVGTRGGQTPIISGTLHPTAEHREKEDAALMLGWWGEELEQGHEHEQAQER
jgi:hypothetical protein